MAESWVNSAERIGADLHLELSGPGGRRAALIRALREAVREGRLAPGTRLPPYRSLAADLGVARNTVADAYAELVAEGWLTARQGSGTRVAERAEQLGAPERVPKRHHHARVDPDTICGRGRLTPRRSRVPPGSPRTGGRSSRRPTRPSGPAIPRAAWNCARPSPSTWHARVACAPSRGGS